MTSYFACQNLNFYSFQSVSGCIGYIRIQHQPCTIKFNFSTNYILDRLSIFPIFISHRRIENDTNVLHEKIHSNQILSSICIQADTDPSNIPCSDIRGVISRYAGTRLHNHRDTCIKRDWSIQGLQRRIAENFHGGSTSIDREQFHLENKVLALQTRDRIPRSTKFCFKYLLFA